MQTLQSRLRRFTAPFSRNDDPLPYAGDRLTEDDDDAAPIPPAYAPLAQRLARFLRPNPMRCNLAPARLQEDEVLQEAWSEAARILALAARRAKEAAEAAPPQVERRDGLASPIWVKVAEGATKRAMELQAVAERTNKPDDWQKAHDAHVEAGRWHAKARRASAEDRAKEDPWKMRGMDTPNEKAHYDAARAHQALAIGCENAKMLSLAMAGGDFDAISKTQRAIASSNKAMAKHAAGDWGHINNSFSTAAKSHLKAAAAHDAAGNTELAAWHRKEAAAFKYGGRQYPASDTHIHVTPDRLERGGPDPLDKPGAFD